MARISLVSLLLITAAGLANADESLAKNGADGGREDASAAVRQASKSVLRSLREAGGGEDNHADPAEVYRFMGFIEGRLGIRPPEKWEQFLTTAFIDSENRISFSQPDQIDWSDDKNHVALEGEHVIVKAGDIQIRVPKEGRFGRIIERAAIDVRDQTAFMTLYDWPPYSYKIFAASRSSGQLLWTSEVLACGNWPNYSGAGWHAVELRSNDEIVAVFGCDGSALYLEAFDVRTGARVCRFKIGHGVTFR